MCKFFIHIAFNHLFILILQQSMLPGFLKKYALVCSFSASPQKANLALFRSVGLEAAVCGVLVPEVFPLLRSFSKYYCPIPVSLFPLLSLLPSSARSERQQLKPTHVGTKLRVMISETEPQLVKTAKCLVV